MLVMYDSLTGNVARFVNKLNMDAVPVQADMNVKEPFILVTYTFGFGNPPQRVSQFLQKNHAFLQAVAASGNRNWGDNFAKSADVIRQQYQVPILLKFEMAGTRQDVETFKKRMDQHEAYRVKQ